MVKYVLSKNLYKQNKQNIIKKIIIITKQIQSQ